MIDFNLINWTKEDQFKSHYKLLDEPSLVILIQQNPLWIQYIENPSDDVCLAILKNKKYNSSWLISKIKSPSEKVSLMFVKSSIHALQYISNPTLKVCMTAIKNNGCAIKYIKNPTEEMRITAVTKTGFAINYIHNPSEQICSIAIEKSGSNIAYIKNPSLEILKQAKINLIKEGTLDQYISYQRLHYTKIESMRI